MFLKTQSTGSVATGLFDAFRSNGAPTYYAENHTPWMADFLEAGLIFGVSILALAFTCILPGIHGRDKVFTFIWVFTSLFVGGVILVTNFSQEWETSTIQTMTKYKAGTGRDINAIIGVHIGLRGINITLKGEPVHQLNETINYNEHFSWQWAQGRLGFGPFAGEFNQEYRAAQFRGLPLPILWIAEYFTLDGEYIRWGRHYRAAGLFAHMCLWLALPLWLLANVLFFMLLRYGAYLLIMTGASMCVANIIKHFLRNPLELQIPFSAEHVLRFEYGSAFWLCLGTGCLCIVCGFIILIMDLRFPSVIARFFGADVLQDDNIIQKEVSRSPVTANNSDNSDLTEIVVKDPTVTNSFGTTNDINNIGLTETEAVDVGSDGKVVQHKDLRPPGAPNAGNQDHGDEEWTDDSDMVPTDEEFDGYEDAPVPQTKTRHTENLGRFIGVVQSKIISRGFIRRFQRQRRQPFAQLSSDITDPTTPRFPFLLSKYGRRIWGRRIWPTAGSETPKEAENVNTMKYIDKGTEEPEATIVQFCTVPNEESSIGASDPETNELTSTDILLDRN